MKMKDKELTIFTPGLSSRSLTMDYHNIDNMILTGVTGSGKDTTLNHIVVSMLESNGLGRFSYVMIDSSPVKSPLANPNRVTPYNELQSEIDEEDYFKSVRELLITLIECARAYLQDYDGSQKYVRGSLVLIVNGFGGFPKYIQCLIRYLIFCTRRIDTYKVIVSGQPSEISEDMLDVSRYVLATRIDDENSDRLFGCNIASKLSDKYGSVWFHDREEPCVFTKHTVKFTPDSLLNKMMKTYASAKKSGNMSVKKYHHIKSHIGIFHDYKLNDDTMSCILGEPISEIREEYMSTYESALYV